MARCVWRARGPPPSLPLGPAFTASSIRTRLYPAAGPMKWSKLMTNLVGNATSAIVDLPVTALFADPQLYKIEKQTLWECLLVMRGLRYPVVNLPGAPVRWLGWTVMSFPDALPRPLLGRFLAAGPAPKIPSLNLDVQAGRARTEVRWLNGAVIRYGAALGIPTPVNSVLTDTVEGLTSGRLDRVDFQHKPEALLKLFSNIQR